MHEKSYLVCSDCHDYFRLEGDSTFLDYHYQPHEADARLQSIQEGARELANLPGFTHITVHDRDDEFQGGQCECCGAHVHTLLQVFVHYSAEPLDRAFTATTDEPEFRAAYDEYLDSICGSVSIAGIPYSTAIALYSVDPVAYNEGFGNWLDSLEDEEYPDGGRWGCPICETNHGDKDSAAECCAED